MNDDDQHPTSYNIRNTTSTTAANGNIVTYSTIEEENNIEIINTKKP